MKQLLSAWWLGVKTILIFLAQLAVFCLAGLGPLALSKVFDSAWFLLPYVFYAILLLPLIIGAVKTEEEK